MTGPAAFCPSVTARFEKVVLDYREGLVRIDREFDAAFDRMDQALAQLRQDPGKAGWTSGQKALYQEKERRLLAERKEAEALRAQRKKSWRSILDHEWERTAAAIRQEDARLGREQPAFTDFGTDHPAAATELPTRIVLCSQHVAFEDLTGVVPHAISFPVEHALVVAQGDQAQKSLTHQLVLRLVSALPTGQLELTFIDPLKLGQSVEPFLPLLKTQQLIPAQRVLTRAEEIEAALHKLADVVEELIQHRFSDKASDWSEYNVINPDRPLRYKVVLIYDVPEQLTDKSLWLLERLCENGPRCGVLPIIASGERSADDRRYEKFFSTLGARARNLEVLLQGVSAPCPGLSTAYLPDPWPRQEALDRFFDTVAERHAANARFKKTLPDLWTNFRPRESTAGGLDIPIGWTEAGAPVSLTLGATTSEHHALLAGKTGSGKSNLLHVIIHSLCEKYSPREVDLYLLDYKESTEFNVYATPPLPHARLVATESDPEYGITVLEHLSDELENRARMFKACGVRDFAEYRTVSPDPLPRVLLVIDEFQVLFGERRHIAEAAEQLLSQLLKQGRSFGIHVLLATQTLKGINALSISSLVTQLGCRIALACGPEDSAMILGGSNWAAAELRSPPEGIINNANGARSGNVNFVIPLAESTLSREHIARLSERAARRGAPAKTRVFTGGNLPELPSLTDDQALRADEGEALLLGERLTFRADALSLPITRRPAFNVLFSGYNDQIHDGLLAATLRSFAFCCGFDDVVYFNGRGVTPGGAFDAAVQGLGARFRAFNEIESLPLQDVLDDIGRRRVALIIDGLDSERGLHPSSAFKPPKPNEPPSPAELLKRIAEEGSRKGTFVFALIDNWRRCAGPCKDLFNLFELRVAFCMNEDDAGALVSGGIGKFKGIEKPNRAVFVNRMTNEHVWFRPYIKRGLH